MSRIDRFMDVSLCASNVVALTWGAKRRQGNAGLDGPPGCPASTLQRHRRRSRWDALSVQPVLPILSGPGDPIPASGLSIEVVRFEAAALEALKSLAAVLEGLPR